MPALCLLALRMAAICGATCGAICGVTCGVTCGVMCAASCAGCPAAPPASEDAGTSVESRDAGPSDEDAGPPPPRCGPGAVGSAAVLEGELLDLRLVCTTGLPDVALSTGPLPDGATLEERDDGPHLLWATDLDDATVVEVVVRAAALQEEGTLRLAVADASLDPANVPPLDPTTYTEEHGLPVIFLDHEPAAEEYEADPIIAAGHRYTAASAKLRGASSLGYPKRSFTLKLDMNDRLELPAVGFSDRKKVVLISTFDDNAYVRQRLAYQVYNRTQPGEPHTRVESASVVLYVGGRYFGLYTLADHVDRDLFEESLGLGDGGNLYKSIDHNANFRRERFPPGSGDKDFLGEGYELRDEPDLPTGQWDDLVALVAFVSDAEDASFDAQLGQHVAVDDMLAWWIFATAIVGEDSFGKNAYLYREGPGAPFRYAPWDFNHSFGQAWESSRTDPLTPVDEGWPLVTNQIWERALRSPVQGPAWWDAYREALSGPLSLEEVLGLFDAMSAEVEASARKDEAVWGQAYGDYFARPDLQDFDGERAYTRAWIVERWAYLGGL